MFLAELMFLSIPPILTLCLHHICEANINMHVLKGCFFFTENDVLTILLITTKRHLSDLPISFSSFSNMMSTLITIFLVCLVLFLVACSASTNNSKGGDDSPSSSSSSSVFSCGDLLIKCPFTLEGHPHNCPSRCNGRWRWLMKQHSCGNSRTRRQLSCENNRTILYISSNKFYVTDISYENQTIQLVDPGLEKDNCSSMPLYSLLEGDFIGRFTYKYYMSDGSKAIVYMNCSTAIIDSPRYVNASPCIKASSSINMYSYVVVDPLVSDFKDSCNDFFTTWIMPGKYTYASFAEVHEEMLNGFGLSWDDDWRQPGFLYYVKYFLQEQFLKILGIAGLILLGRSVVGTLCLVALLIYLLQQRHRAMDGGVEHFLYTYKNQMPTRYSYMDVTRMTKGFEEKLGQGGFGSVFKGFLRNNRPVAIKILNTSKGNGQDFINEVASVGRIHHVNVVKLIGFVAERSKRALIYEFMPNGSLNSYIFPQEGKLNNLLSWERTYEIALGIARGIEYLHRGCDMQILHFDIKPHNILLDENYIPKVSDFGLARLYSMDDSIVSITTARGTMGYMAPELFYRSVGGVSYKSDVYSFGMLLMEMAGRRKNVNALAENSSQLYFPSWIYDRLDRGDDIEMGAATDEEKEISKKMIIVALWCIQMKPINRPSMTKVVEMLEGALGLLEMPPKPFFTVDPDVPANYTSSIEISSSTS